MNTLLAAVFASHTAVAHTNQPALLQLSEGPTTTSVTWTVARIGGKVALVEPVLPDHCIALAPPVVQSDARARRVRWTADCGSEGLAGHAVVFDAPRDDQLDVVVRWSPPGDVEDVHLVVHPGEERVRLPADEAPGLPVWSYLPSGMEHILEGWDHLAFVLGLVLVVGAGRPRPEVRPLVGAVTGFTVGHSLTLAPAALGLVDVPSGATEACIALSILYLAVELTRHRPDAPALVFRQPALVAGVCGLLHGLGFAGALSEVGLPDGAVTRALALFNVGVELGQLLFVGVLVALLAVASRLGGQALLRRGAVWLLGITSAFWTIERALSVFFPA